MIDLVGSLRCTAGIHPHLNECARALLRNAADEVEQLREALKAEREAKEIAVAEVATLSAEIKRRAGFIRRATERAEAGIKEYEA